MCVKYISLPHTFPRLSVADFVVYVQKEGGRGFPLAPHTFIVFCVCAVSAFLQRSVSAQGLYTLRKGMIVSFTLLTVKSW